MEYALLRCKKSILPISCSFSGSAVTLNLINARVSGKEMRPTFYTPACLACDMKGKEEEY